jgi:hypothetical protein
MATRFVVADLLPKLVERQLNTAVGWNRLEGRPRKRDIAEAMRAEVRDALWMLTRQWQMGEFKGDDAGSPIAAAPVITRVPLARYQSGVATPHDIDADIPLEARVEARPIAFTRAGQPMSLDIRVQMGRHWLRIISDIGDFAGQYADLYKVKEPDPTDPAQAGVSAHASAWQSFAAAAGRLMDGRAFHLHLLSGGKASAGITAAQPVRDAIDARAQTFLDWFKRQYVEPHTATEDAWEPERLEYRFAVSAPGEPDEKVFVADEYFHGRLDWYNLDIDRAADSLGAAGTPALDVTALVPVPISFPGMPDTRWWAFEDGRVNLGKDDASASDLGRMLFLEFALLYANDWYMMPLSLASGTIAEVKGIAVTNVFGERFWVAPAGEGIDDDWRRWTMFTTSIKDKGREIADTALMAAAVVPKIQEGRALDEVLMTRDEMANMVWGIESRVPLPDGSGKPGLEAARETLGFFERAVPPLPPPAPSAPLRYDVMSSVAENWIPFVAARKPGSARETLLQRGSLLRLMEGAAGKPRRVTPRTPTLREGLEENPQRAYFLAEEEVPRGGAWVSRSFQRTRWRFGRTCVWIGMRKRVGRGEGASGLAFDMLVPPRDV